MISFLANMDCIDWKCRKPMAIQLITASKTKNYQIFRYGIRVSQTIPIKTYLTIYKSCSIKTVLVSKLN